MAVVLDLQPLTTTLHTNLAQLRNLETQFIELQRMFPTCKPTTYTEQWRCAVARATLITPDNGLLVAIRSTRELLEQLQTATRKCSDPLYTPLMQCCSVDFLKTLQAQYDFVVERYIVYHTNYYRADADVSRTNDSMYHLAQWCKFFNYGTIFHELANIFETCAAGPKYPAASYRTLVDHLRSLAVQAPCTQYLPRCGCTTKRFWETCTCPLEAYSRAPAALVLP